MEAKQTMGTRDIAGGVEHDDDPTVAPDDRLAERDDERADAPELFERDESSGYQSRWETIQTVGPRRGRLDRGPARRAAALPQLLPAPAGRLTV